MVKDKVFAVFGLGTFGYEVCSSLAEKGGKVIAVDNNSDKIERVKNIVTQAILIDSTDEESLNNAPIENIDVAVVGMGDDIEASILTTAILKKLGIPFIISRAISDIHARVLKQVGATEVVNIEIEEGKRVASRLLSPEIIDKMYIGQNQILAEVITPKRFMGKTLQELDLRRKSNVNVISIKRLETDVDEMGNPVEEEVVTVPSPSTELRDNDILVVAGPEKDVKKLKEA